MRLCSSHYDSLLFRRLSRSLRRDWAREMDLNLSVFSFGMNKTRNSFQDLGNTPFWRISLKVSKSAVRIESGRLDIIWLSILLRPGADLILLRHLFITAVSSVGEKGLEKRAEVSAEGVKVVGKEE